MTHSKKNIFNLHCFLFVLFTLLLGSCQAQSEYPPATVLLDDSILFVPVDTSFAFINYDTSHLIIPGDSNKIKHFAEKWYHLLATGEGHISIMQIGASHIQGGSLPHRLRYNILSATGLVSDRGLVFPYSAAAKCNNPYDYRVKRSYPLELTRNVYKEPLVNLGLCGIAVTARDSTAEIGIFLNEPDISFFTNDIILLGETNDSVIPLLKIWNNNGDSSLLAPTKINNSYRSYSYHLDWTVDSFSIVIPCNINQSFSLTGVYLANNAHGISYHSIGVNGASVSDYLNKCPYFTKDLQLVNPDLVIFCIGINDASGDNFDTTAFTKRYLQLVDSIKSVNPDCAFIFVTNNDSYRRIRRQYHVNTNAILVREAFLRIATVSDGAVWDQFSVMGGLESMKSWTENGLAQRDRIHFTRKGYELLADMLTNAIAETLHIFQPSHVNSEKTYHKKYSKQKNTANSNDERSNYISF